MNYIERLLTDIGNRIAELDFFKNFKLQKYHSGEYEYFIEEVSNRKSFSWRFLEKADGLKIDQLHARVDLYKVEGFVNIILKKHDLNVQDGTLLNKIDNNHELMLKVSTNLIHDEKSFCTTSDLFTQYIKGELFKFLEVRSTISGIGNLILKYEFSDLINIGIKGEYPANILKAITIAKWCNNETKYQEFKRGLQTWIDEDRNDPNYSKMCDSYQNALNELVQKLETEI